MVQSQRSAQAFVALALAAWLRHGQRGIVLARSHSLRTALVTALVQAAVSDAAECKVRLLVPTGLLVDAWQGEVPAGTQVCTYAEALRLASRRDPGLLVFDQLQSVGVGLIECLCTAWDRVRVLGLAAGDLNHRFVWDVAPHTGPILLRQEFETATERQRIVLELELSRTERFAYEAARDRFVAVYDPWRGAVGIADWGSFVAWARESVGGRCALRAWHESRRILAWTEAKAAALEQILARHRGQRIVVLTADKASAYAISREHLVMPLTGDLPVRERRQAITAFGRGTIKVLVAPRLLDDLELAGIEVVVDSGRRRTAYRQVSAAKLTYEFCTRQTTELRRQL